MLNNKPDHRITSSVVVNQLIKLKVRKKKHPQKRVLNYYYALTIVFLLEFTGKVFTSGREPKCRRNRKIDTRSRCGPQRPRPKWTRLNTAITL
jgi:hypothetical protein